MSYSFEYIDIILLAMIAGFIFLRLRGILGRKTGYEDDITSNFQKDLEVKKKESKVESNTFDEKEKIEFIKGAKVAYESIITNFASGNLKEIQYLLNKKIFEEFEEALKERKKNNLLSETTFVGINSANIKDHAQNNNILEVTVSFVSEIISCVRDKDKKIVSGDPEKIKKVCDTWTFSRDLKSSSPNWQLIETQA